MPKSVFFELETSNFGYSHDFSKNTNFGIMVPGFYLGLYLKYAVFEFK